MRKAVIVVLSVWFLLMLVSCESSEATEKEFFINSGAINNNILLSGDGCVIDGCNGDFQMVKEGESSKLFRDPFFQLGEGEEITLQYISGTMLYYLKNYGSGEFELHSMDLSGYEDSLIYESSSSASREYDYLGIMDNSNSLGDFLSEREEEVYSFWVLGNYAWLVQEDGIYRLNLLTGHKKRMIEDAGDGEAFTYTGHKLYYIDTLYHLTEYDVISGESAELTSWPVSRQYTNGKYNFVQRMNGELFCYSLETGEMIQLEKKAGTLMYADEHYVYCANEDDMELFVYRITDGEIATKISLQGLPVSVASLPAEDKVYIVEVKKEQQIRREVYIGN